MQNITSDRASSFLKPTMAVTMPDCKTVAQRLRMIKVRYSASTTFSRALSARGCCRLCIINKTTITSTMKNGSHNTATTPVKYCTVPQKTMVVSANISR